jgi:uncharacterized phiE125 gp8 family phage protein
MTHAWKEIEPPIAEPLTIEECRDHLEIIPEEIDSDGVTSHPRDALIMAQLQAAREWCENFTGLVIAARTVGIAMDTFPEGAIELPTPLIDIVSVRKGPESTDELEGGVDYLIDDWHTPARLVETSTGWPTVTESMNTVQIVLRAGYAVPGDESEPPALPGAIRSAMLLRLGDLFEGREDGADDTARAESLLRPLRVRLGMA